jgi:hypothetical protein
MSMNCELHTSTTSFASGHMSWYASLRKVKVDGLQSQSEDGGEIIVPRRESKTVVQPIRSHFTDLSPRSF